jgi:hypothetical protein
MATWVQSVSRLLAPFPPSPTPGPRQHTYHDRMGIEILIRLQVGSLDIIDFPGKNPIRIRVLEMSIQLDIGGRQVGGSTGNADVGADLTG